MKFVFATALFLSCLAGQDTKVTAASQEKTAPACDIVWVYDRNGPTYRSITDNVEPAEGGLIFVGLMCNNRPEKGEVNFVFDQCGDSNFAARSTPGCPHVQRKSYATVANGKEFVPVKLDAGTYFITAIGPSGKISLTTTIKFKAAKPKSTGH